MMRTLRQRSGELLYSGLSWPAFDMSDVASAIGMLMPMTYAGDTLRDILLSGSSPDQMCIRDSRHHPVFPPSTLRIHL